MFEKFSIDDIPPELRLKMDAVEAQLEAATRRSLEVMAEIAKAAEQKTAREENISENELRNALNPVMAIAGGCKPIAIPFEVRGGENDGKRLITLCVMLADGKTVMPVLQVPDFDVLANAEYIGSIEGLEVILPEDSAGTDWQKTISETVDRYAKIHGGK